MVGKNKIFLTSFRKWVAPVCCYLRKHNKRQQQVFEIHVEFSAVQFFVPTDADLGLDEAVVHKHRGIWVCAVFVQCYK